MEELEKNLLCIFNKKDRIGHMVYPMLGMRMKKIRVYILAISLLLTLNACEKKENVYSMLSIQTLNQYVMQEGIVYLNPVTHRAEYFEYKTQNYFPVCGKVNCKHDEKNKECLANRLGRADIIGKISDKWYYLSTDEYGKRTFYSCDLGGENEKIVGEFNHCMAMKAVFYETYCIVATNDIVISQKGEMNGDNYQSVSGIYRFNFETGKTDNICTPKSDGQYEILGQYEKFLVYQEENEGKFHLKKLNLENGEITDLLEKECVYYGCVGKNEVICNIQKNDKYNVVRVSLKTGEYETVMEENQCAAQIFVNGEEKLITVLNNPEEYETYQCSENNNYQLIRKGTLKTYLRPIDIKNEIVVGQIMGADSEKQKYDLATISLEDYLAGKTNWKILEY